MAAKVTDREDPKVTGVRKAAGDLATAIKAAREAGFAVTWPSNPDGLPSIGISETGKAKATVVVTTDSDVSPEAATKATAAAQKAADDAVAKAKS